MSTTETKHPFAGMIDANGDPIPETEEGDSAATNEVEKAEEGDLAEKIEKAKDAADALPPDPDGKALFDNTAFESPELALPKIGGKSVDRIGLKFKGGVKLDRSTASDVALMRKLPLGYEGEMRVAFRVSKASGSAVMDADDNIEAISAETVLEIHTIYPLTVDDYEGA